MYPVHIGGFGHISLMCIGLSVTEAIKNPQVQFVVERRFYNTVSTLCGSQNMLYIDEYNC